MSNSALISWLTACYREDRSRTGVTDFYSSVSVKHRRMTQNEEQILTGMYDHVLLPSRYGAEVLAYTTMHQRGRELLYGSLFVCGKVNGTNHRSPLVLFKAKVVEEEYTRLELVLQGARINSVALSLLGDDPQLESELREVFVGEGLSEAMVGEVRRLVEKYCPSVDTQSLLKWPYLETSKYVQESGNNQHISILSASGLANVERQASTRGVIQELSELGELSPSKWSLSLSCFLGRKCSFDSEDDKYLSMIPTSLSTQQEKVLLAARSKPLSVCHGPPGTGKSYTVAAVALDHVARGESVLVSSRNDHAVNVLHKKIDAMLGTGISTVRAGRREHLRSLKSFLTMLLAGGENHTVDTSISMHVLRKRIEKRIQLIDDAEDVLADEFQKSIERSEAVLDPKPHFIQKLKNVWAEYSVSKRPLLAEFRYHYQLLQKEREREVSEYVELFQKCQITRVLDDKHARGMLQKMLDGIRKRKGSQQQAILSEVDYEVVLKALPVWVTSCEDVHRVLPNKKELFDVAVIDEASQCDLASMLPVMQRAKRVVIVGDTKQLKHVSFLSNDVLFTSAREHGLSKERVERFHYRNRSLMDVAIDGVQSHEQTAFLDEHFRSHFGVIAFSNEKYYRNQLKLMRERPWMLGRGAENAIVLHRQYEGRRNEDGINMVEVNAIVRQIQKLIARSGKEKLPTIGVLSPFRKQVDAITSAVFDVLPLRTFLRLQEEADFLVGTAHSFQGGERDIMLLSLCVDKNAHSGSLRFLEREDVFNVSITRARNQQHVFYSFQPEELKKDSVLSQYMGFLLDVSEAIEEPDEVHDRFAAEVCSDLEKHKIVCQLGKKVAGVLVDLVVETARGTVAIDLIGYPGAMREAICSRKALLLERAGLNVIPVGYLEWKKRKDECVAYLLRVLRE